MSDQHGICKLCVLDKELRESHYRLLPISRHSIQDSEIESECACSTKGTFSKAVGVVTLTTILGVLLPRDQGCSSTHACLWSSGSSKTILFQPSGVTLIAFSLPWSM